MKLRTALCLAAMAFGANCSTMFGQTLTTLVSFNGPNGSDPRAGLVMDAGGNFYGTTVNGGQFGAGTVFEIDAATHSLATLFSFNGSNGGEPDARLTFDANGNLYGTTRIGGTSGNGTVFSLTPSTGFLTTLCSFDGAANGGSPLASVTLDSNDNIYGTTSNGGAIVAGTVFKVDALTHAPTTLYGFPTDGSMGAAPTAGVILGPSGTLIGTTAAGGANNGGTLFKLSVSSHSITTLASTGGTSGGPPSELLVDDLGNLFGAMAFGGPGNHGSIFEFSASGGGLITLAQFNGTNGGEPRAGLIADANGNLYGTTFEGGANSAGTIFELDATTHTITTLASFNGGPETGPVGGLVADGNGNYYGTTTGGGDFGHGIVFELSLPEPGSLSVLAVAALAISICRRREKLSGKNQLNR